MLYYKQYLKLLYSKLFLSQIRINIKEDGLHGKVKYNFPFTYFPKSIKIFIPREYQNEKDYMSIIIPFESTSGYSRFSTAYIRERKRETCKELDGLISKNEFSFGILEKYVFYDFIDFLFDHTGCMRNNREQIDLFHDNEITRFWNVLKEFGKDFWFLQFFLRSKPILISYLNSIPNEKYISEIISKVKDIKMGLFGKLSQLWLVLNYQESIIFIRFCTENEINQIFQDTSNKPKWFIQIKKIFSKEKYEFKKNDTRIANFIFLEEKDPPREIPREICFLFKKK